MFGGAKGLTWLLRDEFIVPEAAALTSPRTCEPGPGTLNVTGAAIAIAGGKLVIDADTSAWKGVSSVGRFDPDAGLAIVTNCGTNTGTILGFTFTSASTANADATGYTRHRKDAGNAYKVMGPTSATVGTWDTGKHVSILRGANGCHYVRSGKLVWADGDITNHANNYATVGSYNCAADIESLGVLSLPDNGYTAWSTEFGAATNAVESPSSGETTTSAANSWNEFTWTVDAAETLEWMIRRTDDTHTWVVRCDQAGSTIKVIEVNGSETERSSTAQTWTDTSVYRVVAIADDIDISTFVDGTAANTYGSASYNKTVTGVKISGFAAGADLICWPIDVSPMLPAELV